MASERTIDPEALGRSLASLGEDADKRDRRRLGSRSWLLAPGSIEQLTRDQPRERPVPPVKAAAA